MKKYVGLERAKVMVENYNNYFLIIMLIQVFKFHSPRYVNTPPPMPN